MDIKDRCRSFAREIIQMEEYLKNQDPEISGIKFGDDGLEGYLAGWIAKRAGKLSFTPNELAAVGIYWQSLKRQAIARCE